MKHLRSAEVSIDVGRLHIFVMDCCFPSAGSHHGITVMIINKTKTKAISAFMIPDKRRQ